jgi:hypothetical protein
LRLLPLPPIAKIVVVTTAATARLRVLKESVLLVATAALPPLPLIRRTENNDAATESY